MLLDTSGLLCLHHKAEPMHDTARALVLPSTNLFTHNYVLAEFVALSDARRLPRKNALDFVVEIAANPRVSLVWVERGLHNRAMALLLAQLDKSYTLCDAISIILMRERGISEALSSDHHFEQAGFTRLLAT